MTVKEAILSFPGLADAPENFVIKVMADREVSGAEPYSKAAQKNVELCAADIYAMIIAYPDFSEGKLAVKIPRAALINNAIALYRKHGETDKIGQFSPQIKDGTNRW